MGRPPTHAPWTPLLGHHPSWLLGILVHTPCSLQPQHEATLRANILGQAGRIQGRNLLALPLLCDFGQVPNPLWALVSSFTVSEESAHSPQAQPDGIGVPV